MSIQTQEELPTSQMQDALIEITKRLSLPPSMAWGSGYCHHRRIYQVHVWKGEYKGYDGVYSIFVTHTGHAFIVSCWYGTGTLHKQVKGRHAYDSLSVDHIVHGWSQEIVSHGFRQIERRSWPCLIKSD
jgi:hypothetical protein